MKTLLEHLYLLASQLNKHHITYALGGSMLLYLYEIVDDVNDIDVLVDINHFQKAKNIIEQIGNLMPHAPSDQFHSLAYETFNILGTKVDLISGLTIQTKDLIKHTFTFTASDIKSYYDLKDIKVPLSSLSSWQTYYELMGRMDTYIRIKNYLKENDL